MPTKMGRPTSNPKRNQTKIRMTDNELEKLNYCCKKLNFTKTQVINLGIDKVYAELKKWEKTHQQQWTVFSRNDRSLYQIHYITDRDFCQIFYFDGGN